MGELIGLFLVIGLAFPIAIIVAIALIVSVRSRLGGIETRLVALEAMGRDSAAVRRLEARLSALEAAGRREAGAGETASDASSPPEEGRSSASGPRTDDSASAAAAAARPHHQTPLVPVGATASASPPPGETGSTSSVPPVAPPPAQPDLEEQFGTRWVVWVGGLALGLGGLFLVRYSIEQGLIGPGVRITLGALLGVALVGSGEWLRRQEGRVGIASLPAAHIPSILTAAGTTTSYATVFAAYDLYGFIGPAMAFVLLDIVALATLAAALLHGPGLAALGLIGAEATPLLVTSNPPNYWALYVYLAVVTAAAFALARVRRWRWLAITAVAFGLFWALPGIAAGETSAVAPHIFYIAIGFALAALFLVGGVLFGPEAERGRVDAVSSGAVAAYLLAAALLVVARDHHPAALVLFALLVGATAAMAWRSDAVAAALPAGALLAWLVIVVWAVEPELGHLVIPGPPGTDLAPQPSRADIALHLWLGAFFAGLFGVTGYLAQGRPPPSPSPTLSSPVRGGGLGRAAGEAIPLIWSTTAVLAPIAILVALYYRIHGLERSLLFSAIALGLAAWFAWAAEQLGKRDPQPGVPAGAAIHAAGAAASLALALTFYLEKGWLTVGLALMTPAITWVAEKRPLPLLRWIAAAAAVLVLARIVWEPRIVGDDLGTTPFFNWLLYGYGVPALSFWIAGYRLRQRADDVPSRTLDAAAILFTVLFAVLEIRHAMNDGDIYAASGGLAETALHVGVGLAMAIALEWLRLRTHNVVHNVAALIVAAATLGIIVIGLFGADNPWLTGAPVGGMFLNLILLGYGLPAGLAIVLALTVRHTRPMPYRAAAVGGSVALALAYLTLEVARLYHGPELAGPVSDPENYTFSAVWLAFGVVLLLVGLLIDSKPARLASAAVVGLTVAKVFLIDMAGLAGIWRALSFIGLGLVLVGIGYLYQRLLFPQRQIVAGATPTSPQ